MEKVFIPDTEGVFHEEHTADLWLGATGVSAEQVVKRIVSGLYEVISEKYLTTLGKDVEMEISSNTIEMALVDFLSELLFYFDAEGSILLDPILEIDRRADMTVFKIRGSLTPVSIPEGSGCMEVKAITSHRAFLGHVGKGWKGKVLLDL